MMQDGAYMNLGEPVYSCLITSEYVRTSWKKQGLAESTLAVGLARSTQNLGKPSTRGRGWQWHTSFSTCHTDTRRSG